MTQTDPYRQAVKFCRLWYLRYEATPHWRLRARRKALHWARYWGNEAKSYHIE